MAAAVRGGRAPSARRGRAGPPPAAHRRRRRGRVATPRRRESRAAEPCDGRRRPRSARPPPVARATPRGPPRLGASPPRGPHRALRAELARLAGRARVHRRRVHRGPVPARDRARRRASRSRRCGPRSASRSCRSPRWPPPRSPARREREALAGALLLAGGAAALAFLPAPAIAWTIVPQLLAGAGMGLALPALGPPSATSREAARDLVARHVGHRRRARDPRPGRHARSSTATTDGRSCRAPRSCSTPRSTRCRSSQLAPALLDDVDVDQPRAGLQRGGRAPARRLRRRRRGLRPARRPPRRRRGRRRPGRVPDRLPDRRRARPARRGAARPAWRRPADLARGRRGGRLRRAVYAVEHDARGAARPSRSRTRATRASSRGPAASRARSRTQALRAARPGGVPGRRQPRGARARALRPRTRGSSSSATTASTRAAPAGCSHCSGG